MAKNDHSPVSLGCKICRLHFCKGLRPSPSPQWVSWIWWSCNPELWGKCSTLLLPCPVGWGCRIHWLHFCTGVRSLLSNECLGYDTKQSYGEVPVMLELRGMWSTLSLPSLPSPIWPRVVAPDRALSMG